MHAVLTESPNLIDFWLIRNRFEFALRKPKTLNNSHTSGEKALEPAELQALRIAPPHTWSTDATLGETPWEKDVCRQRDGERSRG